MKVIPSTIVINEDSYLQRIMSRIRYADDACQRLRRQDALAAIIPSGVQTIRENWYKEAQGKHSEENTTIDVEEPLEGHAYIIRQFKRPDEIKLMRQIYGKLFFQISAYSSPSDRENLIAKKIKDSNFGAIEDSESRCNAIELISVDYSEDNNKFGQRIRETFPMGDVFVDGINRKNCENMIHRFINLIFGDNSITPDRDENGMYLAKSASLRSGDLSRQVGAAIFRPTGEVISLGCNEVPKFGGGNYWCDDKSDARDFAIGEDPNDRIKREILYDILDLLLKTGKLSPDISKLGSTREIMTSLMRDEAGIKDSKVMDLLEFGRIIHAEMSAISDAARLGLSTKNGVLYSTTFPCHICAKHIVAAGIDRVVFLEPYPKSYVKELHLDSIEIEVR
jgi:deoxycytidylate deaminase